MRSPNPWAPSCRTCEATSGTKTLKLSTNRLITTSKPSVVATVGVAAAYVRAPMSPARSPTRPAGSGRPSVRIASSAPSTARKLMPFRKNAVATPKRAMSSPATAGPTMRAVLKTIEFSATAFGRSGRPTRSVTKDCRAGMSTARPRP